MRHGLSGAVGALSCVALLVTLAGGCSRDAFCLDCDEPSGGNLNRDAATLDGGSLDGSLGDGSMPDPTKRDGALPDPCTPRADGQELCNALDDDCDGLVDEGFDLQSNPQHCGACNAPCQADNAEASCVAGICEVGACLDGFANLDDAEPDCEYRCPVFPGRAEDCNGIDDDCDGVVDETLPAAPTDLCNTRAGTPCAGTLAACDTVDGVTTWYCQYAAGVEFDPAVPNGIVVQESRCDGQDGDCDSNVDDPWPEVGEPCDDGGIGVCRDVGAVACNPADGVSVFCDLSVLPDAQAPGVEVCNGRDDDCDGIPDNGIVDDMVHVTTGGDFYIFRYEASHTDATASEQGLSSARACSNPGVLPWTYVTYAQADAACSAAGKRLCTAGEWLAACGAQNYPYGNSYAGAVCNGADRAAGGVLPTGAAAGCESAAGAFDLSGNAKEWTNDSPVANTYVVRGGSYLSPALGLTCQSTLSQAAASPGQAGIGFRCCSSTAP